LRGLATAAAVALLATAASAQTWQTVDDFQPVSGSFAQNYGLCVAPSGTLFAAGVGNINNLGHALVMASSDAGNTRSAPLDDFVYQGVTRATYVGGVIADGMGNLYAAGCSGIEYLTSRWLVRRSTDNGLTWSTVDDFSLGGLRNVAQGIAADAAGNVYVVGLASTSTSSYGIYEWVVRKGVNGTSWSTVDDFGPGTSSQACGVIVHPSGAVYVTGNSLITSGKTSFQAWTTRRTLDGGASWQTVDTFQLGNSSVAHGLGVDLQGSLYAVGNAFETVRGKTRSHWIVRRSSTGGTGTWTTVDDFQPTSDGRGVAHAVATDSLGNLLVAGLGGLSNSDSSQWFVRKNPGGAGSWSTVDQFQYAPGADAVPEAIATDAAGHVFVGGYGNDATGTSHWLIRRF
jgi:hypothetical protein